jgi:predicted transposase/invertase (TIGR01784 family)
MSQFPGESMKRDSIFYKLFSQFPESLFELLEAPPDNAQAYRFDSVAVKEPKFEIDGVFLPPESAILGTVFFCEVQMQKDEELYERLFSESLLYFRQNRDRFADWQAVVIYPSARTEQFNAHPYRALIGSDQVHRVYLDELGPIEELPLGVALMALAVIPEKEAPAAARGLLGRVELEGSSEQEKQGIIELVNTIIVYTFTNLSRQEIEMMLGTKLEETRVYRDARAEEREAIAINLLKQGIAIEAIMQATGLTIEQLQALQAQA